MRSLGYERNKPLLPAITEVNPEATMHSDRTMNRTHVNKIGGGVNGM